MNCWRIQNLLAPYLDGVLPGIEHEAFAKHLGDCPDCERIVADIAALPSFEALDISGEDSALVLDALGQTIAERIAAAAPSIREDGSNLPGAEAGGSVLHFLRNGEVRVTGAAAAAYVAAVLLLAAGIGLNHQHVVDLESSIAERDAIIDGMSARIAAAEFDFVPLLTGSGPEMAGVVIMPAGASGTGALVGSPIRRAQPVSWTPSGVTPHTVSLSLPDEGPRIVH
jgi:anti-sigma factor RsiW